MREVIKTYNTTLLGTGEYGIVLQLIDASNQMSYAVKITDADYHLSELYVSCELTEQCGKRSQAFIKTYGWLQCRGIPDRWGWALPRFDQNRVALPWENLQKRRLVFIFMEHSVLRLEPPPSQNQYPRGVNGVMFFEHYNDNPRNILVKLLFILLHGLKVARKRLHFSHNDIHDGQIVLFHRNVDPMIPIVLDGQYEIVDCPVIAKLIDFGMSVTRYTKPMVRGHFQKAKLFSIHEEEEHAEGTSGEEEEVDEKDKQLFSDDVGQLVYRFHARNPSVFDALIESEAFEAAAMSSRTNYRAISVLLESDFFSEFKAQPNRIKALCKTCMGEARYTIAGTHLYYCGEKACMK